MKFNLIDRVISFLKDRPNQKFTAREIASQFLELYPEFCEWKKGRSSVVETDSDVIKQISAEIGAGYSSLKKKDSSIKTTEGRPREYYFSDKSDEEEVEKAEEHEDVEEHEFNNIIELDDKKDRVLKEHDLYYILAQYMTLMNGVSCKRIDEKRSQNNKGPRGNKWLYPDITGVKNLTEDWDEEIKSCVKQYAATRMELWSFEVKILINRSNVREVFFQAVSNSSWANYGYLVASEISGDDTMKELSILSSLHGIGVILLNVDEPTESMILIPAKERLEIDWNTANRLAQENKDFYNYIKNIRQFHQSDSLNLNTWYRIKKIDD